MTDIELSDSSEFTEEDSSSEDDDLDLILNERIYQIRTKNENYFEITIPRYNPDDFTMHFRVNQATVDSISHRFADSEYFKVQAGAYGKLTPLQFTLIFLWFAGHETASFRDVADRFDITISSLFKVIRRMTYFLSNLSPQIIKWPSAEEKLVIEDYFGRRNFPGVIGVIDGTHVRIDKPREDPDSYLNRKHFFSIQAQIVCDHQKKICDVFIGYPGSVHDSRVFRTSPLYNTLQEKCGNFYILGDSGYPCLRHLLTPFRDRGHLTPRQTNYNVQLAKNRYVIEHCFGQLKQKFRQLYPIKLKKIADVVHFIRACCVLHNICLNDNFEYNVEENELNVEAVVFNNNENDENLENDRDDANGIAIRNRVANLL